MVLPKRDKTVIIAGCVILAIALNQSGFEANEITRASTAIYFNQENYEEYDFKAMNTIWQSMSLIGVLLCFTTMRFFKPIYSYLIAGGLLTLARVSQGFLSTSEFSLKVYQGLIGFGGGIANGISFIMPIYIGWKVSHAKEKPWIVGLTIFCSSFGQDGVITRFLHFIWLRSSPEFIDLINLKTDRYDPN